MNLIIVYLAIAIFIHHDLCPLIQIGTVWTNQGRFPHFPFAPELFRPFSVSPRIVSPPSSFVHFPIRLRVVSLKNDMKLWFVCLFEIFHYNVGRCKSKLSILCSILKSSLVIWHTSLYTVMPLRFRTDRPGQTVQTQIRVYTVCNSFCIVWMHYSKEKSSCSIFRVITANFRVSEINFRIFTYVTNRNPGLVSVFCVLISYELLWHRKQLNSMLFEF